MLLAAFLMLFDVDGWLIRPSSTSTRCDAAASYENDSTIMISYDAGLEVVGLSVINDSWKSVEPLKPYKVEIEFKGGNTYKGDAYGLTNGLNIRMKDKDFAVDIAGRETFSLRLEDRVIGVYSLKDTAAVMREVIACSNKQLKNSKLDPFAKE